MLNIYQTFSWALSDDLKRFGEFVQNGTVNTIQLRTNFKWKALLEGMKPEGSRLIILSSQQLGPEFGNYPSNTNFAIKFELVRKVVLSVEEKVTKSIEKVPRNEDKATKSGEKSSPNEEKISKTEENLHKTFQDDESIISDEKVETKSRLDKLVARVGQPVMMQTSSVQNQIKPLTEESVSGKTVHTAGTNSIKTLTS